MNTVEMDAADALLDRRLKINLPAPWLLRVFGKKTIPVWVKRPRAQNMFRMARLFAEMDIDIKALKVGELGTLLECIGRNGVITSRIIAHGMICGVWSAWWLNRPLAYYLRCHMDMRGLAELTNIIVLLCSGEVFLHIITSVSSLSLTQPTVSQPKTAGS